MADNLDHAANQWRGVSHEAMAGPGVLSDADLANLSAWNNEAAEILQNAARRIREEALPVGDIELAEQIEAEADAQALAALRGELGPDEAASVVTDENVRVVAQPNRGGPDGPCDFHEHKDGKCPEGYQSHHIIQDMFFRIGGRESLLRPNGAPTLAEGMSICLEKRVHKALHREITLRLTNLGETANLFDLANISAEELKKALRDKDMNCDREIDSVLEKFKRELGERGHELLGRVVNKPGTTVIENLKNSWGLPIVP